MAYANGLDFWLQGKWSHLETDTTNNDIGLLYAGIDYKFSDSFLVGVLGQLDWSSERDDTEEFSVKGRGWMFGPYFVARLHDNLILDGRAAWGLSDNDIDPLGFYTDSFETERWLLKSQLTGDFRAGQLRFAPSVGILYFEDKQDSYVDSLGIEIPEQTVALGRLTFGPALEYNFEVEGGTTITPRIALKGIWDFEKAEILDPDTGLPAGTSESDLRGRIEAGLAAELADGFSVVAEGFYDGIGADDLEAYGGSARITVPLN
jgi:outer membrane autotransporter protein